MGIEEWSALELAGAIFAYWAALFVGVVLYARWRARQANPPRPAPIVQQPSDADSAVVETTDSGMVVKLEERINLWIIALYVLGPPLLLALIRFWF